MNPNPDAIIIGGGVIGCSIAYHLGKAGVKATLLERGQIGMEASNAASGILSSLYADPPEPYTRLVNESLAMFHALAPELLEASGVDIELVQCGKLDLALTQSEAAAIQRSVAEGEGRGERAQWLDADAARELEPQISPHIQGALFMPEVCRVNNQRLSAAYAGAAARLGADIRQATEVIGLVRSGYHISGVRLNNDELSADNVIIAAGPWSRAIAEWVGGYVPVRPVRGVNLNLQPAGRPIRCVIDGDWGLLAPRNDGSVIAGATVEEADFDGRVTAGAVGDIMGVAARLVPSLRDARLNWAVAGLRPGSPDDAPMLGPIPGWRGLLAATGHYRSGILLSAITGKLIADHIIGEKPALLEHFAPARFGEN